MKKMLKLCTREVIIMIKLIMKYKVAIGFIMIAIVATIFSLYKENETTVIYDIKEINSELTKMDNDDTIDIMLEEIIITNEIPVYISGEVLWPDVYIMQEGALVKDLVDIAGGFTIDANSTAINLAQELVSNSMIVIPKIGEEQIIETITISSASDNSKVNINTATSIELMSLSGIGESKALGIIEYRTNNGIFANIEDLKNVSGIGDKTFETIRNFIDIK